MQIGTAVCTLPANVPATPSAPLLIQPRLRAPLLKTMGENIKHSLIQMVDSEFQQFLPENTHFILFI